MEPLDLPDVLFAGDEVPGELTLGEDEENDPTSSKPTGDEECQPPRVLRDPGAPSQKDIDEHEAGGHATYRTWCEACVEDRGVGEHHFGDKGQKSKIPTLTLDHLFVTSGDILKTAKR